MPRQKRTSRIAEKAELRAAGMKMIDINLELTASLSLANFNAKIEEIRDKLDTYNSLLAKISVMQSDLTESEKQLNRMAEDMLIGVASHYGKDSYEYKLAGGTRRSERKRPIRKSTPAT